MSTIHDIYMIDESGRLFRKGEEIGKVIDDQLTLNPDCKKYQAPVARWLREKADEQESAPKVEDAPRPKLTPAQQEEADNKGIALEAQAEAAKARAAWKDDQDFATRNGCPQPPKKNPQFGDKTPAYVEWLHKYRHDKYVTLYGVKGKGKVPVFGTDPETGAEIVTGYRETDMATRKTHLTEKIESNAGLGEDMDWNA